ncbi:hypothetical protein GT037_008619 [Alternaria burnsii]|uniref:Uncharacterized protein n=1 Tax=Alternaria burnsii TaxID=1187904 RepID=A0A8H7AXB4_9PLEO|nr:uncharacterized protein GT037_008619 [Alternaria burnsii]KAF7673296.1 hypothetical protein GT037_008619 [Alternaria burnsii]
MQDSHCAFNKLHPRSFAVDTGDSQGKYTSDHLLILYSRECQRRRHDGRQIGPLFALSHAVEAPLSQRRDNELTHLHLASLETVTILHNDCGYVITLVSMGINFGKD